MSDRLATRRPGRVGWLWLLLLPVLAIAVMATTQLRGRDDRPPVDRPSLTYEKRKPFDSSGFFLLIGAVEPWPPDAPLAEVADAWKDLAGRAIREIDEKIDREPAESSNRVPLMMRKAIYLNAKGEPELAGKVLEEARAYLEAGDAQAVEHLYTIIYFQGVTAFRSGETENCILCRGESSCILPISEAARHTRPSGSRRAIGFYTEYLRRFPDDLEVRWLLNLAHMTLGEYPEKVEPDYLLKMDRFRASEFDIGRFRDVSHLAGVNRLNQAGGAIMEDFDNDGLLDVIVTSMNPTESMAYYRNRGDGTFEERSESAGLSSQLGGLYCVQTDYNNDGRMDVFITRGAWLAQPIRPTLLRNDGGTFTDVTEEAGLMASANSISATWADYDNDGWIDLFVCCERQPNRLYRNKGDGTFEDVADRVGLAGDGRSVCKGATWLDFDNDGDPDLFRNNLNGHGQLFRNEGPGGFAEVTLSLGVDGPSNGFSCWAWDYDNDGWLDIFATSYERGLVDVIKGLIGAPFDRNSNRLFRNQGGQGFVDVTREAGLDMIFTTMGSNFADFDNDGFLDMYLTTGEPSLTSLVPNRMFRNVEGRRFAEITTSSGNGPAPEGSRRGHRRLGPRRRRRHLRRNRRCRGWRQIPRHALRQPRAGPPLAEPQARRQENEPSGHRSPDQGRHRRRRPFDRLSPRHLGKQLRREPAPSADRPGQSHPGRLDRDPMAHQWDDPGLSGRRRRSDHRSHGIRGEFQDARREANPQALVIGKPP